MPPSPYNPVSLVTSEDITVPSDVSVNGNSSSFGQLPPNSEDSSDELFVISTYTDFSKLGKTFWIHRILFFLLIYSCYSS